MTSKTSTVAASLIVCLAGTAITAQADTPRNVTTVAVGPVTAIITALNYGDGGAQVKGFLVGTNTLLTFPKRVCAGVGSLGTVGNSVTYSGTAYNFVSGFQVVRVSSFTNGGITYVPAATVAPAAYPLTAGTINQVNYSAERGSINGFVFAPATGANVFVGVDRANAALMALLTTGAAVSVAGVREAPEPCAAAGTIAEVHASSLTVGTTTFPLSGHGRD